MIFTDTPLPGLVIIDVERHGDERGYLARTFCEHEFGERGLLTRFVQSSTVFSSLSGTLRGLHFQAPPHGEVKLIRCTRGRAHVAMVDLRPESDTYTHWLSVELSPANGRQLYVPVGFAQGYQTLEDGTELSYRMSTEYVPGAARGVRWDDPAFSIEWPPVERRILSSRDRSWPDYALQLRVPAPDRLVARLHGPVEG